MTKYKKEVTFIDLFAGAGGFSEGFLQAETNSKQYNFVLASDINENCELTHIARYNHQLGLDIAFLKQDITEDNFLNNLKKNLKGKKIDVVTGGPPCQSFSLAGKRKKFDKKDNLFSHYLDIIKELKPKYFVMENVKGILTKENGKIYRLIIDEIKSIVDLNTLPKLINFIIDLKTQNKSTFLYECFSLRFQFEQSQDVQASEKKYIQVLENRINEIIPKIVEYKESRTNKHINTIRHGFNLLKRNGDLKSLREKIILEKSITNIDNDAFEKVFDDFLTTTDPDNIIDIIEKAFEALKLPTFIDEVTEIITALKLFHYSFNECIELLCKLLDIEKAADLKNIASEVRLYNIDHPIVVLASDYGVPQDRERVLFIGSRRDQKIIKEIPPTVMPHEKVTIFEALFDLDFIDQDLNNIDYKNVDIENRYGKHAKDFLSLIKKRKVDGAIDNKGGLTYSEWSRKGRLSNKFTYNPPYYFRNKTDLNKIDRQVANKLNNHEISKHSDKVKKRLSIILKNGSFTTAKKELKEIGLDSDKRNYSVLRADTQSPTIMTIPDDYIHFFSPRALTVREMARLQSFDDSFVFQGKRTTGGGARKHEIPQCTLVGNAVPPLMARAIAIEILKVIQ